MLKSMVLIVAAPLLTAVTASGAEPTTEAASASSAVEADAENDGKLQRSFMALPGAFYSQETSVGFAAFGTYTTELKGTGPHTWPSSFTATAVYTLNRQASLSAWVAVYLGEANDWAIESEAFVEHFPMNYYGVGPESEASFQIYTRRQFKAYNTVRRKVRDNVFVGLSHELALVDVLEVGEPMVAKGDVVWTADDQLGSGHVPGGEGTRVHALGGLMRWDTRDNNQSSKRGALVDLEVATSPSFAGSKASFSTSTLDVRGFVPFSKGGVVSGQWLTQLGVGEMPFTSMVELGGDDMLRGMYQGRYRDRSAMSAQLEIRHPIIWRFGAVGFVGAGHVFPAVRDIAKNPPRWTAGGGLRFEMDEESHSTIRMDLGAGPDGTGFIFTFGEAF